MAEAIISDVVSAIITTLGSAAYKKIMFARDLNSHIKRLQQIKTTIEATLLDAMSLESCSNSQKDALEKLDCALADLDYFLDATSAKAKQKEIMKGNRFIKEVRLFFSKSNQLISPFRDSHKLKAILEQFESISRDQALIKDIITVPFVSKTQMVSTGSLWSNCHILSDVVIGRDKDRDKIVSMLLEDSLSSNPLSVYSIVGIGGVGKTTLAKYVYHDERLKNSFDVHLWVSITQDFDVHKILLQILATFLDQMPANCGIAQMCELLKEAIRGKKLLLFLDNVWYQEGLQQSWLELRSLLSLGAGGSKIIVTTRSEKVSEVMDFVKPFMLRDLRAKDSWLLFQKIAFTQFQESGVEAIGREIVKMCRNVPLVIRIIGGLLAGKCTIKEWKAFRDDQLANFSAYGRDIIKTLKLSYDQLDEKLKLCIAYCSLFPKGYRYHKDTMIQIWISLEYIEPPYKKQLPEDAAKEYIKMLAMQGFFTKCGEYMVMHDLMHDLMLSIVGFKYKMVKTSECEIDKRVRHLSLSLNKLENEPCTNVLTSIFNLKQLQSLLVLDSPFKWSSLHLSKKIYNTFPRLRILILSEKGITKVPSSLGELINLRYLDLSKNPITHLPNSITQLVELLSLNVTCCNQLHKFPKGIKKLVKLRYIMNRVCPAPIPKEVASLTELQTLEDFPIEISEWFPGEANNCGLEELNIIINRPTNNDVRIIIIGDANSRSLKAYKEEWEIKCNREFLQLEFCGGSTKGDEMVLEAVQPNSNLEYLKIQRYKGERLPTWIKDGSHYFENLVKIILGYLEGCTSIGSFGGLLHLKFLSCESSFEVEYVEENWWGGTTHNGPYFPSLEELCFSGTPKLKGWYKVPNRKSSTTCSSSEDHILLAPRLGFPKLQYLKVPNMDIVNSMTIEFRGFSSLETLCVFNCENLRQIPFTIHNLSNLKILLLFNCYRDLKERCRPPNGRDWPMIKHIPDFRIHLLEFNRAIPTKFPFNSNIQNFRNNKMDFIFDPVIGLKTSCIF